MPRSEKMGWILPKTSWTWTLGTAVATSEASRKPILVNWSLFIAEMAAGTLCTDSERRCAVTMLSVSSEMPALAETLALVELLTWDHEAAGKAAMSVSVRTGEIPVIVLLSNMGVW